MICISDPGATYERVFARLQDAERNLAEYEAKGWTFIAALERRRIGGLKATLTRIRRQFWDMKS
jgi:hypothetical protein